MTLPTDKALRKMIPLQRGLLDYFPDACAAVAHCSYVGNEQHNPGQPLHWAREKSTDQEDALLRHMMERGTFDEDGVRHSAKIAWRALAALQLEIEHGYGAIWDYPNPVNELDFRAVMDPGGVFDPRYAWDYETSYWTDEEYDEAHFLNNAGYRNREDDNIYARIGPDVFSDWEYDEAHSLNTWTFTDEEYHAAKDDNLYFDLHAQAHMHGVAPSCPYDDQDTCDGPNALWSRPFVGNEFANKQAQCECGYQHGTGTYPCHRYPDSCAGYSVPAYDSTQAAQDIAKYANKLAQDLDNGYNF